MSDFPYKRVLVLASNSFTGSHLIEHLLEHTDAEIAGVSRSAEYDPVFLAYLYRKPRPVRFSFHRLNLISGMADVCALCDTFRPDAVVNFAAQGEVRSSWNWPGQWYAANCMAVVALVEHLRKRDYLRKYVAISTPEVYGITGERVRENDTYRPSTPYAVSKLAGDLHLMAMHKRYGFPVVFTRAANLYGLHQQLYRIVPRTFIYLKMGRTIELHGRGETRRSFIHARDVADATMRAMTHGRDGEVYHLATNAPPLRIADLVRMICDLAGARFEEATRCVEENFGQDALFSLDAGKAHTELEWRPRVRLADGLREVQQWIDGNWAFISTQPLDYVHQPI